MRPLFNFRGACAASPASGTAVLDEASGAAFPADNYIGAVAVVVTIPRTSGACIATLRLDVPQRVRSTRGKDTV